ncbi:MAG: type II toxin-antitoxin system VapC family toxin [Gaiellaceae bacterium]
MALIVLDASVVIGYLDALDAHHVRAVAALEDHAEDDLRLPASAYAEVLVRATREGVSDAVRTELENVGLKVEPIGAEIAEQAAGLRAADRSLRLPDALVIACGIALGADAVLTADESWGPFPLVRVIA